MNVLFWLGAGVCWLASVEALYTGYRRKLWLFGAQGALFGWVALVYTLVACGYLTPDGYARWLYPMTPAVYLTVGLVARYVRGVMRGYDG